MGHDKVQALSITIQLKVCTAAGQDYLHCFVILGIAVGPDKV